MYYYTILIIKYYLNNTKNWQMLLMLVFALSCEIYLCSVYNDTDMIKLGNRIKQSLKKPVGWHEPTLERDTHVYCDELQQLYQYVKMNDSEGEQVYNEIKKHGGPPQIKCEIDKSLLKKQYDWSDYEVSELNDVLEETKDKWERLGLALQTKKKMNEVIESVQKKRERKRLVAEMWRKKLQNETFLKQLQEQKRIRKMKRKQQQQIQKESEQKKQSEQNNRLDKKNQFEENKKRSQNKQRKQWKQNKQVKQMKQSKQRKQRKKGKQNKQRKQNQQERKKTRRTKYT